MKRSYIFSFSVRSSFVAILVIIATSFIIDKILISKLVTIQKLNRVYSDRYTNIILGSSRAQGGFVLDDECNYSTYNYSLPGTANKLWLGVLPDLLTDSLIQRIIICVDDTDSLILHSKTDGDYSYYWKLDKNSLLYDDLHKTTREKIRRWPFYLFGEGYNIIWKYLRTRLEFSSLNIRGSRIELGELSLLQFESSLHDFDSERIASDLYLDNAAEDRLELIDNLLSNSSDTVVWINLPNFLGKPNLVYERCQDQFSGLCQFYTVENFAGKRELFFDAKHFSFDGAVKLTEEFSWLFCD